MPGIRPINKRLLPHTILYEKYIGDDGWGSGGYESPIEIRFVRVEPKSNLRRNATDERVEGDDILILDRIYSSPFTILDEKDKVTFDGKVMEVKQVKKFYAFGDKIHHIEVGLI